MQNQRNSPSEPLLPESERGFWSLIVTQFQGAFSDNALKQLAIFLGLGLTLSQEDREGLVPLAGALLSLPFIVFSMAGGFLADRYSKRTVTIGVKLFEVAIILFACLGLVQQSLPLVFTALFLTGTQSALFGPSKYGLLPELLSPRRLSWGNGILELGTFLAIILGTVAGSILSEKFSNTPAWSGVTLLAISLLGLATSFSISRVPPADPVKKFQINFVGDLWHQIKRIRRDRVLSLAILGNTYFWSLGGLLTANIILYCVTVFPDASQSDIGLLQVALAIGIGIGSVAAGYLSGGKIEYGLIPLGAAGLSLFGAVLAINGLSYTEVAINLCLLGFFGGFFAVPVNAIMQHRPGKGEKGGVLATQNLLASCGIFASQGVYYLLKTVWGIEPGTIFLISSIATGLGTLYALSILPDALLRFVLWVLTHTLYRIRVVGRENIPEKDGALFVCNHLSMVDGLLLLGATDRPIRFILFQGIYDRPFIKPFARILGAIPISSQLRPREMILALRKASAAIQAGEVVCIFAEGQVTRIGQMLAFRKGFERIMKDVTAPIIPVNLDGVWGSIFSFEKKRFFWKLPKTIPYPVTVSFGPPMPSTATAVEVRQSVQELQSQAWHHRKARLRPLDRAFVQSARRYAFRLMATDATGTPLRYWSALVRSIFLARRLGVHWKDQTMVGILVPPSVPGMLVNLAALLAGRIPVNLNYTNTAETIASCIDQCGIRTVITSRQLIEKLKMPAPRGALFLEDLAAHPRFAERCIAFLISFLPSTWLGKASGNPSRTQMDDLATVIFSSGSTGIPKGVQLTHYNIASNVEQLRQVFALSGQDRILGILPFFHSFGFTGTLALPSSLGMGVAFHPTPLDTRAIGRLVSTQSVTFLLATPTFLQMYLRGCAAEDFGSLQIVMTGAEKLPERLATAFEEKFGIRPMEGYGCTECSPVVTVNTRDFRASGFRQTGSKRGTIGHPLPGVSVRIVDPETGLPRAIGEPGLLLVKGPNVMQGYLNAPEKTAEVLRDGWYTTGDIAAMDVDGFLQITDRLSRFSKIGGEMVPHIKIEERLHELAGLTERHFVVTGVPDPRKGERLVVLHTLTQDQLESCLERLGQSGLPNLWVPRPDQFFSVETFPYLGTGKLDLRAMQQLALKLSGVS
ncbi:MAG: MFS transporter [Verrucomicrobia bacterium]|nr:MFS transporter [Verrucomicrobiota bacterium]